MPIVSEATKRVKQLERALPALDVAITVPASVAADLLCDIRHYCDTHGIDFAKADAKARSLYLQER